MYSTIENPWIFHGQYHGFSMDFGDMAMVLLYLLLRIYGGNHGQYMGFPLGF